MRRFVGAPCDFVYIFDAIQLTETKRWIASASKEEIAEVLNSASTRQSYECPIVLPQVKQRKC